MDFHPHDITEHLTMIEYGIFSDIRLSEITSQAWNNKANRRERAPNVVAMIERSNKVSFWVATEVNHNSHFEIDFLLDFKYC